ncbi:MAG: hypothetical protein E7330_04865 [Clostridiales bacterium]|nr:hypothetical protein [Clostridiales bacterium]
MPKKNTAALYRFIKGTIKFFYPKTEAVGTENLPDEPCIIVGNHTQMNGPIAAELYMPFPRSTWCAGQMMDKKDVPAYAFQDFWSEKPAWTHPFYKLLSHAIAPVCEVVFTNAETIGVYHDARILSTFRSTVEKLSEGISVVIFPEHNVPFNHILYEFQDRFIDVAKLYYRKTKQALSFVPLYIAPKLHKMYFGTPIRFSPDASMDEERKRISAYLMEEITAMAVSLPRHRVIPYRNIPKKDYPYNI